MSVNMLELRARNELRDKIKNLVEKYYDQNLYAARTRGAICKDIAKVRDELVDEYKVSMPIVALYVGEYGRMLKAKMLSPSLLKGEGCVGFCKEPEGGGINELQIEKLKSRRH